MAKQTIHGAALALLIFIACVSQPRYRTEPVEKKTEKAIPGGEEKNTQDLQFPSEKDKSNVDRAKMGGIIDSFLGAPYKLGGENRSGTDCSGLVTAVYRQYAGFSLPHDTKKLYLLVKRVEKKHLAYGDLVFFSDTWLSVSHVGIYLGEGKFVHSIEGSGVIVSALDDDYYGKRYRGARRVIP
ncbi:MAG: C40 family peptidase [Candidatus Zixiibacteriota bacterium]